MLPIIEYALEYYPAPGGGKSHFAVICPGGAYALCASEIEGVPYAKELNRLGYTAFVLRYHHGLHAASPKPIDDLARALRTILKSADKYNVYKEGYSVWGSSAGGHLAGCFGTELNGWMHYRLPRPAAVVLAYPVITMGDGAHERSRKLFLGPHPTSESVNRWSVEQHIGSNYPATFIWNSDADETVRPDNSRIMATALKKAGVPYEYTCFENVPHGVGVGTGYECEGWIRKAAAFWGKHIV